jgi:hypothetical protein
MSGNFIFNTYLRVVYAMDLTVFVFTIDQFFAGFELIGTIEVG